MGNRIARPLMILFAALLSCSSPPLDSAPGSAPAPVDTHRTEEPYLPCFGETFGEQYESPGECWAHLLPDCHSYCGGFARSGLMCLCIPRGCVLGGAYGYGSCVGVFGYSSTDGGNPPTPSQ